MRNKLLKFIAILVAICALPATGWAQRPLNGASISTDMDYVMYNPGTDMYYAAGNAWGTQASISLNTTQQVRLATVSDGVYTIRSVAGATGYLFITATQGNEAFVDGGQGESANWIFTETSTGVYTIQSVVGKAGTYFAPQPTASAGTVIWADSPASYGDDYISWLFFPVDKIELYRTRLTLGKYINKAAALGVSVVWINDAYDDQNTELPVIQSAITELAAEIEEAGSASTPLDFTDLIVNPGFDKNTSGWNNPFDTNNWNNTGLSNPFTVYAEKYVGHPSTLGDLDMNQTITGLPNGKYTVGITGIATFQDGTDPVVTGVSLYAGTNTTPVSGASPATYSVTTVISNGTLQLGVRTQSATANWIAFDNFTLTYLGFDASALIDQINTLIGSANTAIAEGRIERSVQTALQQSITNAQAAIVTGTKAALESAAVDLPAKLATAHASIAEYNEIRELLDWAQDILTNTNYPGLMIFNDALFAIEQILADQTFEKTRDIVAIKTAVKDYVISQTGATADTPNDYTLIIENNSFETGDTSGWTLAGSSSDTGVRANSNATYKINNADGDYVFNTYPYGFGISQTITEIPNGQYEVSVLIGQDAGGTVTIFANDETKVVTHTGDKATGETGTISVTVTDGTLTLGTKDGANWYKVDNFQLQYKGVDIDALKAALKAQIDIAEALSAKLVNTYTAGIESVNEVSYFKGSLSIIQGIYETSNYANQLALVTGTMKNDIATITDFLMNEYSVDVAFAVKNNDFSDGLKNWDINGNVTTRSNEHYSGATNPYFDSDNWEATNWNVNGTQTVTGLEQGLYRISFTSRASIGSTVAVTLTGDETLTMPVNSVGNQGGELGGGWNTYNAFVLVGYDGSLQISIDASASLASQWMSIDDFTLRKVGTYAMVQDGSHLIASGYMDNDALMFFHLKVSDPYAGIRSADVSRTTGDGSHELVMTPNFIMYGLSDQFSVQNCIDVESGAAITLDLDYPFHAPTGFSSEVSFSRRPFDLPVNHTRAGGWQTICLPFDVDMDNITCDDGKGNLVPITLFEGTSTGLRPFWLYRADATEGLKAATEIKANVPYLMLVPNDTDPETGYADYYNISGTLTFRGTAIVATDLQAEDANTYFLNGCFAPIYDGQDNTIFGLNAAGMNFVAGIGTRAFTAYANSPVNGSAKVLPVLGGDDATSLPEGIMLETNKNLLVYTNGSGIVNILSTKAAKVSVYTLDGKLFGMYDLTEGVNEIQLPGNKYVINGNVVIVY